MQIDYSTVGTVECRRVEDAFGCSHLTDWKLVGGPYFMAELPSLEVFGDQHVRVDSPGRPGYRPRYQPGMIVHVGPFRFRYVDYSIRHLADLLVVDGSMALPRVWAYRWFAFRALLKTRVILTLHVWGLARHHRGAVPEWFDVQLGNWHPYGHAWQTAH